MCLVPTEKPVRQSLRSPGSSLAPAFADDGSFPPTIAAASGCTDRWAFSRPNYSPLSAGIIPDGSFPLHFSAASFVAWASIRAMSSITFSSKASLA